MGWKTLLKSKEVDANHWSSGKGDDLNCNRCIIRVLEGANLLSSDAETGKSDPICFLWVGPEDETPSFDINNLENNGILTTKVIKCTIDPHWNSEHIFPMELDSVDSLNEAKAVILIRDEDLDEDNVATYDDLGQVIVSFKDIIKNGKIINNTIVYAGKWYPVMKCPGMRKVSGQVKLAFTLVFTEESSTELLSSLGLNTLGELLRFIKHGPPKITAPRRRPSSASSVRSLASSRVASPVRFKSRTARSSDFSTILETIDTPQAGDESMPDGENFPEGFDPLPQWEEESAVPAYEDTAELIIKDEATLQEEIKQWENKKAQAEKQRMTNIIHNTSELVVNDVLTQGLSSITKDKSQKMSELQSTLDALKLSTAQIESSAAAFSPESKKAKRTYSENPIPEKRMKYTSSASNASAATAVSSLELPPLTIPPPSHKKKNKQASLPEIDTRADERARGKSKESEGNKKESSIKPSAPRDKPRGSSSKEKLREFKQQQKQKLKRSLPEIPSNPNVLFIPAETPKEEEPDTWMMGDAMGGDEAVPDEFPEEIAQARPPSATSQQDEYAHGSSTATVRLLKAMEAERKSLHEEIAKLKALGSTIASPMPNYRTRSNTPGKDIALSSAPTDAIDSVLKRGNKEQMLDLVKLLEPSVEEYPAYYLNVVFDLVSESLLKHRNLEACFSWIDSLLKARMIDELNSKTFHQIVASLDVIGMDPSRKGVLAMRLQHLLQRAWRP